MKEYVVGFLFDSALQRVALIRKNRPAWQAGKFNGIGGKVEDGETPPMAMVREFREEAGVLFIGWRHVAELIDENWVVHVFAGVSDLVFDVEARTDEPVIVTDVRALPESCVPNVPWLVPLLRYALRPGSDLEKVYAHYSFAPDPRVMDASQLFNIPPDQVTEEHVRQAKEHRLLLGLSA